MASTLGQLDQVEGVADKGLDVRLRRRGPALLVGFHEVDLHRLVAGVDQVHAGQVEPSEVVRPERDPGGAVEQPQPLARQPRVAVRLRAGMRHAGQSQVVGEEADCILPRGRQAWPMLPFCAMTSRAARRCPPAACRGARAGPRRRRTRPSGRARRCARSGTGQRSTSTSATAPPSPPRMRGILGGDGAARPRGRRDDQLAVDRLDGGAGGPPPRRCPPRPGCRRPAGKRLVIMPVPNRVTSSPGRRTWPLPQSKDGRPAADVGHGGRVTRK